MANFMDDLFNEKERRVFGPKPKPEKGTRVHGRWIDGAYYVRLEDIVTILELNDVLPGIKQKWKDHLITKELEEIKDAETDTGG